MLATVQQPPLSFPSSVSAPPSAPNATSAAASRRTKSTSKMERKSSKGSSILASRRRRAKSLLSSPRLRKGKEHVFRVGGGASSESEGAIRAMKKEKHTSASTEKKDDQAMEVDGEEPRTETATFLRSSTDAPSRVPPSESRALPTQHVQPLLASPVKRVLGDKSNLPRALQNARLPPLPPSPRPHPTSQIARARSAAGSTSTTVPLGIVSTGATRHSSVGGRPTGRRASIVRSGTSSPARLRVFRDVIPSAATGSRHRTADARQGNPTMEVDAAELATLSLDLAALSSALPQQPPLSATTFPATESWILGSPLPQTRHSSTEHDSILASAPESVAITAVEGGPQPREGSVIPLQGNMDSSMVLETFEEQGVEITRSQTGVEHFELDDEEHFAEFAIGDLEDEDSRTTEGQQIVSPPIFDANDYGHSGDEEGMDTIVPVSVVADPNGQTSSAHHPTSPSPPNVRARAVAVNVIPPTRIASAAASFFTRQPSPIQAATPSPSPSPSPSCSASSIDDHTVAPSKSITATDAEEERQLVALAIPPRGPPATVGKKRRTGPNVSEDDLEYFIRTTGTGEEDDEDADDERALREGEDEVGRGLRAGLRLRRAGDRERRKRRRVLAQILREEDALVCASDESDDELSLRW